jgi:hypothetical protein
VACSISGSTWRLMRETVDCETPKNSPTTAWDKLVRSSVNVNRT